MPWCRGQDFKSNSWTDELHHPYMFIFSPENIHTLQNQKREAQVLASNPCRHLWSWGYCDGAAQCQTKISCFLKRLTSHCFYLSIHWTLLSYSYRWCFPVNFQKWLGANHPSALQPSDGLGPSPIHDLLWEVIPKSHLGRDRKGDVSIPSGWKNMLFRWLWMWLIVIGQLMPTALSLTSA